ncbi:MAG: Asp/Glu/hydantoin racemase, partial [Acidimicrobiales bacterium]
MLTPSSNTVLEPYVGAILHELLPEVTAHFQRFTVQSIGLDDT